jgi:hypothetical protein
MERFGSRYSIPRVSSVVAKFTSLTGEPFAERRLVAAPVFRCLNPVKASTILTVLRQLLNALPLNKVRSSNKNAKAPDADIRKH